MRKKLIFLSLFLIIIGVVGCIFTFNASSETTNINQTEHIDFASIQTISIDTTETDVEIITTKNQPTASIELSGKSDNMTQPKLIVTNKNNHVQIKVKENNGEWFKIGFNIIPQTISLKIYVPEKMFDEIEFNSVTGDLYLENVETTKLNVMTTSGDVDGSGVKSTLTSIDTITGDINLEDSISEYVINTTSGDIYLHTPELTHPITIDSISGDVEINTSKKPTNVKIHVNTLSGDVNIFDEFDGNTVIGEGTTVVDINTTSGDILIDTY